MDWTDNEQLVKISIFKLIRYVLLQRKMFWRTMHVTRAFVRYELPFVIQNASVSYSFICFLNDIACQL